MFNLLIKGDRTMNSRNPLSVFDNFMHQMNNDLARSVVGYDRVLDGMRNALGAYDSYPPFNVETIKDNQYRVTFALAGFSKDDVEVSKEGDWLTIAGKIDTEESDDNKRFIHKGIATRAFTRRVQLAVDLEVTGAEMKDGLLHISLERIVPEEKKPRVIKIK